jgi:hypothetical protein
MPPVPTPPVAGVPDVPGVVPPVAAEPPALPPTLLPPLLDEHLPLTQGPFGHWKLSVHWGSPGPLGELAEQPKNPPPSESANAAVAKIREALFMPSAI